MLNQTVFKLMLGALLAFAYLFNQGWSSKCAADIPTVKQTQVGFKKPPIFLVEVQNNCPMCPVIDVHVKCGNFSQDHVNPNLFKVLGHNDCVVNGGLPLAPLQKISFNYSHRKFVMSPSIWYFQCE
ncbi:Phd finger protein [Thalictrum thalictroides]|uniref:Phd finger protein n=1 Tax=Thalictrum thalictroides TaxID=46969 RepID=A0A7J6WXS9_THATH|nr:Phd finger protein [Thalictrum thalictroides]